MKFKHMLLPVLFALSAQALAEPTRPSKWRPVTILTLPEHATSLLWSPPWMTVSTLKA